MSSQSPHRNRKPQMHSSPQSAIQSTAPRELSPSPSIRERQRAMKAHSMTSVPTLGQGLSNPVQQVQQPSPTISNASHQSRRTPPTTSRISPTAAKVAAQVHAQDRSPDRPKSPPPLLQTQSQPVVPRPLPWGSSPQYLQHFHASDDKWQMTEELMKDIERADLQQAQFSHPAGTSGLAYAGGAASSNLTIHHYQVQASVPSAPKDPAVERVRASDRSSPKEQDSGNSSGGAGTGTGKRQSRESPITRDRSGTVSSITQLSAEGRTSDRSPEYRGTPQYVTPMTTPSERTAAYTQYIPEGYQASNVQGQSPGVARKPVPAVSVASDSSATRISPPMKATSNTPPLQLTATQRLPDRSLPVQEEPEEDAPHDYVEADEYQDPRRPSPSPSPNHGQRYDNRRDHTNQTEEDDEQTLNEEAEQHLQASKSGDDSSGFTPRSPSATLPEHPHDARFANPAQARASPSRQHAQTNGDYQKTVRAKTRVGSTDQIGLRNFDPAIFEREISSLKGPAPESLANGSRHPAISSQPSITPDDLRQQYDFRQREANSRAAYGAAAQAQYADDLQSLFEDPTSAYIRSYLQSPGVRPNAPIPPTPQTHTAAPSPSPLISAMHSEFENRPIGSPYPYPFTHIRRSAVDVQPQAPSSSYVDVNDPQKVREALARQMQIYAMNNGLAQYSDSAFSPSSTPFPGPGYNPWAFVPAAGHAHGATSVMSMRSSPSHEPVPLPPPPPMRGRGLRRRDQTMNLRTQQVMGRGGHRFKPPPRVDSTQPRETSPEPSSGEETAGERLLDRYAAAEAGVEVAAVMEAPLSAVYTNGDTLSPMTEEGGEWIDEDEEGVEDDLLQLEFHPSYVNNPKRRRRRFETRWEALMQAFQALDRETDATLVLMAAPSHTGKLYSLTSRSLRREASLYNSPVLASMRGAFQHLAAQRRSARCKRISLAERLSTRSGSSADGSSGSGELHSEEDLRNALEAALGSLGELGKLYEERESRWKDEMRQISEDREKVELLLRQALGPSQVNGHGG
ncbi:hypothetical protein CERSUDRAFT_111705 [Gelatoporia subvermispora B]|uniref:Uncharacterized protein n=1 Tax=Ceriporiopsis subvermispora (strain B) TaxID=914234 RepID=M2PWD2_CERS8|nr:hypothetical protein CERSUDRAFT_111705 [Gelatoporia subvermispora B]